VKVFIYLNGVAEKPVSEKKEAKRAATIQKSAAVKKSEEQKVKLKKAETQVHRPVEKKATEKKPVVKQPEEKKTEAKKPERRKSEQKKVEAKKKPDLKRASTTAKKKPEVKKEKKVVKKKPEAKALTKAQTEVKKPEEVSREFAAKAPVIKEEAKLEETKIKEGDVRDAPLIASLAESKVYAEYAAPKAPGNPPFNSLEVHSYPNGDKYEGEWKDGKRNGRGKVFQ
jgi:hypothetical protein